MQACFASFNGMTDEEIETMRTELKELPGMETETVEKIMDAMKNHRDFPVNEFYCSK